MSNFYRTNAPVDLPKPRREWYVDGPDDPPGLRRGDLPRRRLVCSVAALKGREAVNRDWVPTPEGLAHTMAKRLVVAPAHGARILEPSAGEGSLLFALRARGLPRLHVTAVEQDPERYSNLKASLPLLAPLEVTLVGGDFLALRPEQFPAFDAVLMSPPFCNDADPEDLMPDITHVRHAWPFLRPGGSLVALMHERVLHGSTRALAFLLGLERFSLEYLPKGTFAPYSDVAAVLLSTTKEP